MFVHQPVYVAPLLCGALGGDGQPSDRRTECVRGKLDLPPYGFEEDDRLFKAAIEHAAEDYRDRHKRLMIRAVTEKDRERLERLFPGRFEFEEEPDIEDYIYDGEKMRTLAGASSAKAQPHQCVQK